MHHFQFQSKLTAKTAFPATILHQRQELAQNKALREDNRSQAALQKNSISAGHIKHMLNSKDQYLTNPQFKTMSAENPGGLKKLNST